MSYEVRITFPIFANINGHDTTVRHTMKVATFDGRHGNSGPRALAIRFAKQISPDVDEVRVVNLDTEHDANEAYGLEYVRLG